MVELTSRERLQPSLLDRLSDDAREQLRESREQRVMSMRALRKAVLRDLGWLLNSTSLSTVRDLSGYPLVARSVLNFGLPDLSGKTASGLDSQTLSRHIQRAIEDFEPRILPGSVCVTPLARQGEQCGLHRVSFEIQGELWGQPLSERLYVKTELDLESGDVRLYANESMMAQ
ncbi:type VI secretion system baseplate subunit TssE [Pseudomonas sp. NPDC089752]|uniref:type VI secretion system baseplate subunit TssE n=1 Tax=Pseudomonas sp. NPDC089752 TaxID=3364472 RepID=UPI0038111AEB